MAHIDNLIAAISDPTLRAALETEYRKTNNGKRFGLVFDSHKPESILLPRFSVRRGDKVRILEPDTSDRTRVDDSGIWTVARVDRSQVTLTSRSDRAQRRELPKSQVVVTREFGDPIFPGLLSTGAVECGAPDRPWHAVINGENYHALQALLYPYEGRVDVIYIDPPYNTGARDWKYNNDYVDDNDPYRHSKWLSFMEKRLLLAKRLLDPADSALIVTIDEKEVHRLGLLLEQVFPAAQIQMVSSVINPKGATRPRAFGRTDEYIYFVQFGDAAPRPLPLANEWRVVRDLRSERLRWAELLRAGTNARREDRERLFYAVFLENAEGGPRFHSVGESFLGPDRSVIPAPEGTVAVWPIRSDGSEGNWQLSPAALREAISDGYARIGGWRDERTAISYLKRGEQKKIEAGLFPVSGRRPDGSIIVDGTDYTPVFLPGTQWRIQSHEAGGTGGTGLLNVLMPGRRFPFPKSVYAVEDALRFYVAHKPNALVIDFFAGSGTTGHAVVRLNREDDGARQCVMVTNNEVSQEEADTLRSQDHYPGEPGWEAMGICEYITKPRMRAAITGRTPDGEPVKGEYKLGDGAAIANGYEENVEFFDLNYEDPALVSLGRKFHAIAPLLWLKAGAVGARIDQVDPAGWTVPADAAYGILFDTTEWSDFVEAVVERHDKGDALNHAFIVTDSGAEYRQIVAKLESSLPTTRLYADYLRTFEINTGD